MHAVVKVQHGGQRGRTADGAWPTWTDGVLAVKLDRERRTKGSLICANLFWLQLGGPPPELIPRLNYLF